MKTYEANGWTKLYTEDNYEHGEVGKSGMSSGRESFTGATLRELIDKLKSFCGVDNDANVLLDSCEEPGRIDIQRQEDDDGYEPNKHQIEEWKLNQCRLWSATYTFYIQEVERKNIKLSDKIEGDTHKHRKKTSGIQGFSACVNPYNCNPMSHGGVTIVEWCACGAMRKINSTGGIKKTETGNWEVPT